MLLYMRPYIDVSAPYATTVPSDALGLATIPGSSDPSQDEWPMFHGQLNHTGEAFTIPISSANPFWNYTTGNEVHSSPAVVGGRVYIGSCDRKVYCLNATTGGLLWKYTTGGDVGYSSPAVAGGRVYIGSWDNKTYCLNATTGGLLWSYSTGGYVRSSPAVAGGRVYVGSWDKKIYCLNATAGGLLWNYSTGARVSSSPAVAGGRVFVGSDYNDNKVYCLDANTGGFLWSYTTGAAVYSSPAVAGGRVYIGSCDRKVYCLNATTGGLLWSYSTDGMFYYSSPAVAGGRVYIGTVSSPYFYCLNATTGKQLWNNSLDGRVDSSPAVAGGRIYVGSGFKVYCLNATTGKPLWNYRTGSAVDTSSPAVASGRIYVGSQDNKIYCLPSISTPTYMCVNESADPLELGSTETITIAGVAALSGIQTVLIAYEGRNHTMAYLGGNSWRYNAWIPSHVGNNTYIIYIKDNVANWNVTSGAIQVGQTRLNVILIITSPSNGARINSSKIWINGTVSAGPGQTITKMHINNPSFTNATTLEGTSSGTFGYYNISHIANGILSINITAVNGLGNMSYGLVTFTVLDTLTGLLHSWSYATGSSISNVVISSDGQYIAASNLNGNIYLFQRNSSAPLWSNSTCQASCVAISSDGQYIVAGSGSTVDVSGKSKVYLFQYNSSKPIRSYSTLYPVTNIAISSDGQYIVAGESYSSPYGDYYGGVETFLRSSPNRFSGSTGTGMHVRSVTISNSSSSGLPYIAAAINSAISFYELYGLDKIWGYMTGGYVQSVAISNDGEYITAGSNDHRVYLFQCSSLTPLWAYSTGGYVQSVAISSAGQYIAAGSNDNKVYLFQCNSSTPLWTYSTDGYVQSVAISSGGQYITAGSNDTRVYLFQRTSSTPLWSYSTGGYVKSVTISSAGQYIAAGGTEGKVYFFDVGNLEATTPFYTSVVESSDPLELGRTETITVAGVLDLSGIQTAQIAFEGSNHTMTNLGGGTWCYNTWTPNQVGNYSYTIYFRNNVGHWNTTEGSIQVVDTTPPAFLFKIESANPLELGGTETIAIAGVADLSGIQSVVLAFEGSNHTMTNLGGSIWRFNTWTPSSAGDYPYTIYIQDAVGNWNATGGSIQVFTTTLPTYTSIIESADPLELGGTETITITGVADFSGIKLVLIAFEGSNHTTTNLGSGTWRYNTWIPSSTGDYPYTIYLQDNVGNWNATSGMIHVVNATRPTYTSVIESANPLELGRTETITIAGVADLSGIQTIQIAFAGSNHTMTNLGSGTWHYLTWIPSYIGNYSYMIYLQDNNGNWNATSGTIQVVDTTPPTWTSVMESANPLELGRTETITIAGVADLSGIQTVRIAFAGSNYTMTNLGNGTWRYNTWIPSSTGNYPYTIYLQDNIGNWNATSGAIQVVDTTPSTYTSVMESADPLELGRTETITMAGVADLSGIQTVQIAFEGSNHTMTNLGGGTWNYLPWNPTNTGTYPYIIYLQDNNGNWNATSGAIQVVDTTPPTYTSVIESADPLELGCTETITIAGVADLSGIQTAWIAFEGNNHTMINLGSGTWHYLPWNPTSTGAYPYTIYFQDNNGNWNATSGAIQVVDTTPPTYTSVIESANPLELGSTETITIAGVADFSVIKLVLLAFNGSNHTMINLGSGVWRYNIWNPSGAGTYPYEIYLNDNAGNWNTTIGLIQVVDTTPPTYTSIIESSNPLELGDTETITIIGVTDISGIHTVLIEFMGGIYNMSNLGGNVTHGKWTNWFYDSWIPDSTGTYPYIIYIQDNAGNWNTINGAIQVQRTTTPLALEPFIWLLAGIIAGNVIFTIALYKRLSKKVQPLLSPKTIPPKDIPKKMQSQ